jgi:hypothetical protein
MKITIMAGLFAKRDMDINGNHSVILKFQPKGIIIKPFQLSIVLSKNLPQKLTLLPFWIQERLPSRKA